MGQFKKALILVFVCHASHSINVTYQAFNFSCLNSSYVVANSTPIQLTIPPYSSIKIQADLRHLSALTDLDGVTLKLTIQNTDQQSNYTEELGLIISTNTYILYAGNNLLLSAYFTIDEETTELTLSRSYLFARSVSALVTPPQPVNQVQSSFLFVITAYDLVNLPYNVISSSNANNFNGYFLTQPQPEGSLVSSDNTVPSYSDYWNGFDQLAMPYIPYFSNCQNSGDYLYFSQIIHNASECQLYGYNSTPINQFKFGSSAIADTCTITRNCVYDQIPGGSYEYPTWNTLDSTSPYLFYVTAKEYPPPYGPVPTTDYTEQQLIPCTIASSSGDNTTSQFPLQIQITIGYYQQTQQSREILSCEVEFSLYAESTQNFKYQLGISFAPLNHTEILLDFGFDWYIYMLVFIIIGVISNVQFIIFWVYHAFTTVKKKIHIRLTIYLRMMREILKGVFFAVAITIFLTFSVQVIMNGTFFGNQLSSNFNSFWDFMVINNVGYFASTTLDNIRIGRMGFTYIIISIYLAFDMSHLLVGKERKNKEYGQYDILGRLFKPLEWNKGKFLFGLQVVAVCSAGYIYFTYSSIFNTYIWYIIVMMQIAQMVIEELMYSLYDDVLVCLPMKLALGVLAYLATMGAIDLYYFILGYLVDVGISTIEIAYLTAIQERITKYIQEKNEELHRFYINLLNDEEQEEHEKSHQNNQLFNDSEFIMIEQAINQIEILEEEIVQDYNEVDIKEFRSVQPEERLKECFVKAMIERTQEFQKKNNKAKQELVFMNVEDEELEKYQRNCQQVQLLVDSTTGMVQYLLQPFIIFMLWITYNESMILSNFQITSPTCILFLLSSIILAICYQFNIIIIIHVLELYFNFDYKELIDELQTRFREKTAFWVTDSEQWEESLNNLEMKLRGCRRYCLSSQMFFAVSFYAFLIYIFIIGFCTIISSQFNIFQDPLLIPITLFWLMMLKIFEWLLKKLVQFFNIWDYATFVAGGKRISEQQEDVPSADQETQQMMAQSAFGTSSIRFTFKQLGQESNKKNQESREDKRQVFETKLKTICKKLEPTFQREDFRLEYAIKNKEFIRNNIQKILPLIESFPENDSHWLGRGETVKLLSMKKKKEAKNIDPGVSDFVSSWLKRVEANRARRKEDGFERERRLKKCNFCFKAWAIYYGYEGICLECSRKIFLGAKNRKQD